MLAFIYMHTYEVPEEAKKRVSDLLELQVQMIVICQICTGNRTCVLWKIG